MGARKAIRGDVQALRAIAVAIVIVAHSSSGFLPGGFVGVDVFFVISGYLIAGLLLREVAREGRFSLVGFWARRARRILPAATVVTVTTVVASLVLLPLIDTRGVVGDALWASLFLANVHFANQDVYYFSQGFGASPLQHYWSLAVEEQFYLAWPLLLLALLTAVRATRRMRAGSGPLRRAPTLPRRAIATMLLVVTAASFAWSLILTEAAPAAAYFSTLTRAWELGVGALAALVTTHALRRMSTVPATVLATVGLAMIAASSTFLGTETAFPGYAAALPVFGTALVLVAGSTRVRPLTSVVLDIAPLRVLGDWSYSLYLWHWPALVLPQRLLGRPLEPIEIVGSLLATLALAALTFRYVETPFRTGRAAGRLRLGRGVALYPVSLALVAGVCAASWTWTDYQGGELGDNPAITVTRDRPGEDTTDLVRASVEAARRDVAVPSDLDPDLLDLRDSIADVGACDYREDVRALCPRGALAGERTMVLIGDSHARAWIPAFDDIAENADWRSYYLVKSQCAAAQVTVAPVEEARPFTECDDFHAWVVEQVRLLQPDLVVVTSSPPVNGVYDADGQRQEDIDAVAPLLLEGYNSLFTDLQAAADRVVLLRDVPKSSGDPGSCLSGQGSLEACMFEPVERSQILADVSVASAESTGTEVVDPTPWLCYQDDCPVVIGGTLSYRDTSHLTTEYAARLSDTLGRALHMIRD